MATDCNIDSYVYCARRSCTCTIPARLARSTTSEVSLSHPADIDPLSDLIIIRIYDHIR